MIKRERQPEKLQEQKEYNAEVGITKAVSIIERLLESQEYVVVAISGSSTNVGKTYISAKLMRELIRRDISFSSSSDMKGLTEPVFSNSSRKGHVLVLSAEFPALNKEDKIRQDDSLKKQAERFGLPLSKIDLRIFVYRPDKPFNKFSISTETADILIRNEGAIDDIYKIKE